MKNVNFLSLIVLFGSLQGFILSVVVFRIKDANQKANRFLALFVFLISAVLVSRLVYVEGFTIWRTYPHLFLLPDLPLLFYGPAFYLYLRRVTSPVEASFREAVHFFPGLLHIFLMSFYLFESGPEYMQRMNEGRLLEVPYIEFISLFQIGIYLIAGIRLINKVRRDIDSRPVFDQVWRFLRLFIVLNATCWLLWLYSAVSDQFSTLPQFEYLNYNISWIAFSFSSMVLAVFAMGKPEVFQPLWNSKPYARSAISDDELTRLDQKLEEVLRNEKPFLTPDLTIADLAHLMQSHPKNVSRLINERRKVNFFDFINQLRVEEFKRLASGSSHKHLSTLAIAFEAGFNSKTAFYSSVKRYAGTTPAKFVKEVQNTGDAD